MRTAALWALLTIAGCGFHVAATGSGPAGGDGGDAPAPDSPPDARADGFVPACMSDVSYSNGPDGHRYKQASGTNRDGAVDSCAAAGAHLAVIDNVTENDFLKGFQSGEDWIGIDDLTREGTFTWVMGSSSYTNWHSGEPNNSFNEDCAYMRNDGGWNDTDCNDSRAPLCECEIGYAPPPTPTCRSAGSSTDHEGRKYFIHGTPLPWAAAQADCASTGAYLVVPADDDENDAVDNDFFNDSWIGLSDSAMEGTWAWVNGAVNPYTKWNFVTSSPHPSTPQRNCVVVNIAWTDIDCTTPEPYACECDPSPP